MTVVTIHEAKKNLSKLIAEAMAGGEVVIASGRVLTVRLVPVERPGKRQFGALRGKVAIGARFKQPLPEDELAAWAGD